MPGLADALLLHRRIGLDTMAFIYHFEGAELYSSLTQEVFDRLADGSLEAVTSVLTVMELTVRPLRLGTPETTDEYEAKIMNQPGLELVPIEQRIARRAAELRAAHGIAAIDAVQVASCIAAGATAFLTNDRRLRRVAEIEVLLLDDFVTQ